jgi:hypothetical protein
VEAEYTVLINQLAQQWLGEGLIAYTHEQEPFSHRLAKMVADLPDEVRAERLTNAQQQLDSFVARTRAMFEFQMRNPKLGSLASSLLGADVSLSPLQHLRPHIGKPAASAAYVELNEGDNAGHFWHMDQAVTLPEGDLNADGLTAWVPFVDVDESNGCILLVPDYSKEQHLVLGQHSTVKPYAEAKGGTM